MHLVFFLTILIIIPVQCINSALNVKVNSTKNFKTELPSPDFIAYTNKDSIEAESEFLNFTTSPLPKRHFSPIQNAEHLKALSSLTYDYSRQTFFYSEFSKSSIHSVTFNNSEHKTLFVNNDNTGKTYILAFEPLTTFLYATIYNDYTISRLDPFSKSIVYEKVIKRSALDKFRGLAIDPCEGKLYFTNGNEQRPRIERCNLDGKNVETLIDKDISHPRGLTVDPYQKKVYWGDRDLRKIEEVDFQGGNRRVIASEIANNYFSIGLTELFVYWTDRNDKTIYRALRNFNEANNSINVYKSNLTQARGIVSVQNYIKEDECDRKPDLERLNKNNTYTVFPLTAVKNATLKSFYLQGQTTRAKWFHNGEVLFQFNSLEIGQGNVKTLGLNLLESVLKLSKVSLGVDGKYSFVVSNRFQTEIVNYEIETCDRCIPKIQNLNSKVILTEGIKNGILSCKYESPTVNANVTWTNSNPNVKFVETPPSSNGTMTESIIRFPNVNKAIGGDYICLVSNEFGSDSFTFNLEVGKDPYFNLVLGLVGSAVLICILATFAFLLWGRYQNQKALIRKLTDEEIEEFFRGNPSLDLQFESGSRGLNSYANIAASLPFDEKNEISFKELLINTDSVLGQGQFGLVYKGVLRGEPVAVKTVKPNAQTEFVKATLSELKIMAYIGEHENIVKFLGAQTTQIHENIVHAVIEFSPFGDLHSFLKRNRSKLTVRDDYTNFDTLACYTSQNYEMTELTGNNFQKAALSWCKQIADGMDFLESKKVIHSDLAARNVLMFHNSVVKISDFGLSRQLINYTKYIKKSKTPLPFRWMALESLKFMEFTSKSDVWGFGVTIWEIFSMAAVPYAGFDWSDDFISKLCKGMRLKKPEFAPDFIYEEMKSCWHPEPDFRPNFKELSGFFQNLLMDAPTK